MGVSVSQGRKKRATLPREAEIEVTPTDYEPSKSELEEELPMPNLTLEEAEERFMRPFRFLGTEPKKGTGRPRD